MSEIWWLSVQPGLGIISDIAYINMTSQYCLWESLYIGMQQQVRRGDGEGENERGT
jgi:hypothetical protein